MANKHTKQCSVPLATAAAAAAKSLQSCPTLCHYPDLNHNFLDQLRLSILISHASFLKKIFIYYWLLLVLHCCLCAFSHCSLQASHCNSFSCCGAWALVPGLQQFWHMGLVVAVCGLQIAGSVVLVHGLSCPEACGIFRDQESNWYPLRCKVDS